MNMYDSYGDGWNGASYTITDLASGVVYGTGTLATGSTAIEVKRTEVLVGFAF